VKYPAYAFLLVLVAGSAQAQIINGVSTFTHGATVTVTGTSFGTKPVPAPVVWDNVESGAFSSGWQSSRNLKVGSESRHGNSAHCGTINFQGNLNVWPPPPDGSGYGGAGYFVGPNSVTGDHWFAQYWFKMDNNWNWGTTGYPNMAAACLSSVKFFRLGDPNSTTLQNFVVASAGYAGNTLAYQTEYVSNSNGNLSFGNASNWQIGVWHLFQFEFQESSLGANNGVFRWWVDGTLLVSDTDIMTREGAGQLKRPQILGFYDSWDSPQTDRNDFYIDDAYIDTSWARVELGNASVYSQCTHREIQIPSSWGDTSINVTANLGSFPSTTGTYMFVVNSAGTASPGFALVGGADPGPPGAPSTPVRQ